MAFVADASVVGAWVLNEDDPLAESALARLETEDALAPDLLWHEIRNILIVAVRRNRIGKSDVLALLQRLADLPLENAGGGDSIEIVRLAGRHRLSAYDAAYLALAVARKLPLATMDKRLAAAARAEGVALVGPAPRA
ncbi:MAG: type II toxin-antitoxin system VapC family toxin [Rhodospirillales bacterium]|nr:type II toxin-antitoxin system VapC family toxin [Rhodospirillales bacterium]